MKTSNYTTDKLIEIQHELQNQKLWNVEIPNWVNQYPTKGVIAEAGFIDWLQFIFLPNKMNETKNKTINLTSIKM